MENCRKITWENEDNYTQIQTNPTMLIKQSLSYLVVSTSTYQTTERPECIQNLPANHYTLDFLCKKHVRFDQGLDFLIFPQGNRRQTVEKRKKTQEQ